MIEMNLICNEKMYMNDKNNVDTEISMTLTV